MKYKQIGGILLAIILTATGTLYLENTGDYQNCRGLWKLNNDGTYTCSKDGSIQYCYEIEDRGSGWYRCWIGKQVNVDNGYNIDTNSVKYKCSNVTCTKV